MPPRDGDSALKRRRLVRMRWTATGLLVLMAVIYALSVVWRSTSAVWPYIGAFAEAAMVGALADWFAVSALFRHPLGLPLPHTAIIPKNKDRIADNLGNFIQGEFFSAERVQSALAHAQPVAKIAAWLAQDRHAAQVAATVSQLLAFVVDSADHAAVRAFLKKAVSTRFSTLDLSTLAGTLLEGLTQGNRHQALLDQLLHAASEYLHRDEVKETIADFLKGMIWRFLGDAREKIAYFAIDKTLTALMEKLDEVDQDPDHPLRHWFSRILRHFIDDLKRDPQLRDRIKAYQAQMAANNALSAYVDGVFQDVHRWLKADLAAGHSSVQAHVASMTVALGTALLHNRAAQAAINDQLLHSAPGVLDVLRPRISAFIAGKMKEWSTDEAVEKLELNIGTDLQFIRFNGTLVGGLIGLVIYVCTVVVYPLASHWIAHF